MIINKEHLTLCLIKQAPRHEDAWRSGDIALILHHMELSGHLHIPVALQGKSHRKTEPVWMLWRREKSLTPTGN
jgi:hypothetical protein